jgi:hypothetical protein
MISQINRLLLATSMLPPLTTTRLVHCILRIKMSIGMIVKRGATISAAEGGCMAEVRFFLYSSPFLPEL